STTSLSDTSPSAATIFSAAFGSARKFCPSFGLLPRFPPAVTLTLDGMGSRLHLPLAGLFGPFLEALPMKITFAASECVPFSKTGGLADVVGALPQALAALGHEVTVFLPKYKQTKLAAAKT